MERLLELFEEAERRVAMVAEYLAALPNLMGRCRKFLEGSEQLQHQLCQQKSAVLPLLLDATSVMGIHGVELRDLNTRQFYILRPKGKSGRIVRCDVSRDGMPIAQQEKPCTVDQWVAGHPRHYRELCMAILWALEERVARASRSDEELSQDALAVFKQLRKLAKGLPSERSDTRVANPAEKSGAP